ncbi:MAG: class I SAM-dependent methyltransferase [Psychrilyobacter sp.]|nr:class I SAM-dependent methyltransferase [Psychrilyobacter sp.]
MDKFNNQAKKWDTEEKIKRGNSISKAIAKNINLNKQMNVLDFGCGTGLLIIPLLDKVKSIHGIDLAPNMLKVLDNKGEKYNNLTTELTNIFEIDSKFNLIMSSMVMHHIEDTPKLAEKLYDSLEPNGILAIADLSKEDGSFHDSLDGVYSLGYSNDYLEETFLKVGFKEVKVVENIFTIEKKDKKYPLFLLIGTK